MWTFLRVVVVQWLLARIGVRWLLSLAALVPLLLVFVIGIPTLLALGVAAFLLWRLFRKPKAPEPYGASDAG